MSDMNSPYASSVMDYYMAGWSPLWLPYAKKSAPPVGYTGKDAKEPSEETLFLDWASKKGNIAVKLPDTILGIDFDRDKDTGAQTGWAKYLELCEELGALPVEVVSTSRESLQDGFTAFFRVSSGVKWKSGIRGVIDIIRGSHRYQVVAPSIHDKTGREYEWRSFSDNRRTPFIPEVDALPELPEAWVEYFTDKTPEKASKARTEPIRRVVDTLPAETPINLGGVSCAAMRSKTGRRITELKVLETSRHDAMVSSVMIIVLMAHCGHAGGRSALSEYFRSWSSRFSSSEATERDLRAEFDSAVSSAKRKLTGPPQASCTCGKAKVSYKPVRGMNDIKKYR